MSRTGTGRAAEVEAAAHQLTETLIEAQEAGYVLLVAAVRALGLTTDGHGYSEHSSQIHEPS